MPLSYYATRGGSLVYSLGHGTITDEDILSHTCLLAEDELIAGGVRELVDLRSVSGVRVSRDGFTRIIGHDKLYRDRYVGWRCAIVAASGSLFGWSKTFTTLRRMLDAPGEMKVFRSIEKACEWLGVDEEDIIPHGPSAA
jgi:hypothetical protein